MIAKENFVADDLKRIKPHYTDRIYSLTLGIHTELVKIWLTTSCNILRWNLYTSLEYWQNKIEKIACPECVHI